MKKLIILLLVTASTLLFFTTFAKADITDASIVGTYQCRGFDPINQQGYSSVLTIKKNLTTKNTFYLEQAYPKVAFQADVGIGYIYRNHFVAMFRDPSYGISVIIYAPDAQGNLRHGEYLYYNHANKGIGTESCTKNK